MKINYTKTEWNNILDEFSRKVKKKEYRRTDYDVWKAIVKTNRIEYAFPMFSLFQDKKELVSTSHKDESFGSFLYNYYKEKGYIEMIDYSNSTCGCATSTNSSYSDSLTFSNSTNTISYGNSIPYSNYNNATNYYNNSIRELIEKIESNPNNNIFKNEVEEKNNMKGFNFDFGPCSGDQVHISMYGIAVKNAAGVYVSYNAESGEIIDVDILNFDGAKFLFKVPVAISEIKIGDVIIHNRKPMFVINNDEAPGSFKCVDVVNGEKVDIVPTKNMFGFNFMTKVVSLFNSIGDTAPSPEAPFGNMLPFFMMNGDMDPMMMMFMMKDTKMDPMMMMLMCQKDKDMTMPLMMYMMQKK